MYTFLTDEWIEAARALRVRYADRLPDVTVEVRINQVVTGVPFGEGTIRAYIDSTDGNLDLELGELDEPDVTLTTDYETAKAMVVDQDPAVVMQSFMAGKITVQGDMMKLMAMQTSVPVNEASVEFAAELQSITA
ncbi:MAG: SCP2 sterol-binding domain-containing protein [Ilumatobacteraceae bacterium]|nr:SCP2 sterol-binding domain-containing protein [Ilumatobacteraceae bacterium]